MNRIFFSTYEVRIISLSISVSALFIVIVAGLGFPDSLPQQTKIGVIVALTGPLSTVGASLRDAFLLADEKFDYDNRVQFLFEDDQFLPRLTVAAAQKLITQEKVAALAVFGANTCSSVVDITERHAVPLAGLTVFEAFELDKKYAVRFFVDTASLTRRMISEIQKRGVKRLALISTIQDAMLRLRDQMASAEVAEVVASEEFLPGDLDFRAVVAKIRALAPDAVYLTTLPPQSSNVAKQLRQGGYRGQIFASIATGVPSEIRDAEGALEGAIIVTGDDRAAGGFYKEFSEKFSSDAFSETAFAYDLGKLLIEAVYKSRDDINFYLHNLSRFRGVLGTYGSDRKNSFDFKAVAKIVREGKLVSID